MVLDTTYMNYEYQNTQVIHQKIIITPLENNIETSVLFIYNLKSQCDIIIMLKW
jgi:hypothetical protein